MKKTKLFLPLLAILVCAVTLTTCEAFTNSFKMGVTDNVPLYWNGVPVYHHAQNVYREVGLLVKRRQVQIGGSINPNDLPLGHQPFFAKEPCGEPYDKPLTEDYFDEYIYLALTNDEYGLIGRYRGSAYNGGITFASNGRTGSDPSIKIVEGVPTADEAVLVVAQEILILTKDGKTFSVIDVGEGYAPKPGETVFTVDYNKHYEDDIRNGRLEPRSYRVWLIRGGEVEHDLKPQYRNGRWWANFFGFQNWLPCHMWAELKIGKPSPVNNFPSQVRYRIFLTLLATHELPDAQTAAIVPPDGVTSNNLNDQPPGFYATRRAEQIADNLLAYQRPVGGWSKNVDMVNNSNWHYLDENTSLPYFTTTDPYSTLDNDATHVQLQFLGRVISAGNRSPRFMEAFFRGLRYVLRAQYLSGGFPQFIEPRRTSNDPAPGYWNNITINDDAMASVMELLEDIYQKEWHMSFVAEDPEMYKAVTDARNRAIECMLRSQQKVRGANIRPHDQLEAFEWLDEFPPGGIPDQELTVWCQQHDPVTLGSARGRAYEVRCIAGMESASIIQLLMRIPNPGPRIKYAVHASVAWYRRTAKVGYMQERIYDQRLMRGSVRQDFPTGDPNNMVWNRFYELLTGSDPLFVGRDTKITWDIYDLTTANRDTYMNIHNRGEALFPAYEEWVSRPSNPDFPEFDGLPEMIWPGMPSNLEVDRERKLTWQQLRDLGEI